MQDNTITFQLATQYLSKIALRLERLFEAIEQACTDTHPIIHHYALKSMIEIIKLIEKPELKGRFLKELMRIEHALPKSRTAVSNDLYAKLFVQVQVLSHLSAKFGGDIHHDAFIQTIRLAQSAHSSDCELHSPQLLLWLASDASSRQQKLRHWLSLLQPLCDTVTIYLALLRNTAEFSTLAITHGFYHRATSLKNIYHLIMLNMDKTIGVVPHIQLGHHGLSLSFCQADSLQEVRALDITVQLAMCHL